ncbi:MAG TPA: site-specific DNA-methyltransferase, partial [Chitinophagales bacterium]|nr:site-specific DNA-methyltransferase [Chitinophagales bacterium]
FISIDDNEAANLKLLCDEVFGEENFVATNVWKKKQGGGNDSKYFVIEHEYILCYTKNIRSFSMELDTEHELDDNLYPHKDEFGEYGLITLDKSSIQFSQSLVYEIKDREGNGYLPRVIKNKQSCWRWSKEKVERDYNQLVFKNGNVYTKYYRPEGVKPKSLLHEARFGRTETGKEEITKLLGSGEFSYPKPLTLITHFIRIATKYSKNDIILDFFAGSGTTAQAVMELNAEDGGNRRFICVQLPEATEEKSEAYKAGYKTIADITRARIQKVIDKIAKERDSKMDFDKQALPQCNNYTLAPSNFKSWRGDVEGKEAIAQLLLDFTESQKQGSQTDNMLVELCLKSGLGLNVGYQKENGFYKTTLGVWFCFETYTDAMKNDIVAAKPQKLVCLNSCFTSDEVLSNLQLELKENGIICLII